MLHQGDCNPNCNLDACLTAPDRRSFEYVRPREGERERSGIRERAAIVAVLNSNSANKAELVGSYCADHPKHAGELAKLLHHLKQ